jgi:hypothetical protein
MSCVSDIYDADYHGTFFCSSHSQTVACVLHVAILKLVQLMEKKINACFANIKESAAWKACN